MAAYDRAIATAQRLIKKQGQLVRWRQLAKPSDLSEPWKQQNVAPVDNDVYICFLPIDKETREFLAYIRGTDVVTGAIMGLMGQVPFDPELVDVVIRNGVTLRVKSINLLAPNGQKVLYTVEFDE